MSPTTSIWPGTGIAQNYIDQIVGKIASFDLCGKAGVAEQVKKHPIKKYSELYPIDDKNKETTDSLDAIAETVNTNFTDSNKFAEEEFKKTINEVIYLIAAGIIPKYYKDV